MSTVASEKITLPVPVLEHPHWRVHFQPDRYEAERIPSLAKCVELVEQNKVALRHWPFPCLSPHEKERVFGSTYIGSWTNSQRDIEYWRLYQSSQFVHLHAVDEFVQEDWKNKLQQASRKNMRNFCAGDEVPGYFSLLNLLYRITEIFEFATRLALRGLYESRLVDFY